MEILVVLLPAGISFYTFESISYNLDIYYGRAKPASVWVRRRYSEKPPRDSRRVDATQARARGPQRVRLLHHPVSAPGGGADHPLPGPGTQLHERSHTVEKFATGIFFFSLGMGKKILIANPVGELADVAFRAGFAPLARCLVRGVRLRLPDLFRLLRLLGHGDRARADVRLRVREELRLSVQVAEHHGVLAPLAHLALDLAAGLPLHPPGRESRGRGPDLPEPDGRHAARRILARGVVELPRLGSDLRRVAGARTPAREIEPVCDGSRCPCGWR